MSQGLSPKVPHHRLITPKRTTPKKPLSQKGEQSKMPKIVAIVGATGTQGGAVISALEGNPSFQIRALTRNTNSEKAKDLASRGIEVVAADLNDESSLVKAFADVSIIYAVTNFFEPFATVGPEAAMEIEYQQGVNLAQAASQTPSLELYIWSTLPDSRTLSSGAVVVPHFAAKARVDEFIKQDQVLLSKTVFLWVTFYTSNLFYPPFAPVYANSIGKFVAFTPVSAQTRIASLGAMSNVGTAVAGLVENDGQTLWTSKLGASSSGAKYVIVTTTSYTVQDYYSAWAKAIGKGEDQVKVLPISFADYEALFAEWGTELGLMMRFWEVAGPEKSWATVGQTDTLIDSRELLGPCKTLVETEEAFAQVSWDNI
ncbi:HSCARG dehydrogenase [Aspergillus niger ATCC 13496]|uniref:HSCARG dehydrogenase n=3 Tax=Aspergillus niger TaxID=5061 RepID=A0A370BST7_ASPNG|nr:HSCARG dehydrogenase [Aspergillus niger ATCC 13496]